MSAALDRIERSAFGGYTVKEYLALEKPPPSWPHGYVAWAKLPESTKCRYRQAHVYKNALIKAFYEELDQLLKEKQ